MTTVTPQRGKEEKQTGKTRKRCGERVDYERLTKLGKEESLVVQPNSE
jgi:hypothetical protein